MRRPGAAPGKAGQLPAQGAGPAAGRRAKRQGPGAALAAAAESGPLRALDVAVAFPSIGELN